MIEVLISTMVCILLSIASALRVSIHEDLLIPMRKLMSLSVTAGLVGTITGFLGPIYGLASAIPTINEIPAYMFQGVELLLPFFFTWFSEFVIGFASAFITYVIRLLKYYDDLYVCDFF